MAELITEDIDNEDDDKEVEPYPIPRKIRTRRPVRTFACVVLLLLSGAAIFFGYGDFVFDPDKPTREATIESLNSTIDELETEQNSVDTTQTSGDAIYSPKTMGDVFVKAQNEMLSVSISDSRLASAASSELAYVADNPSYAAPWYWSSSFEQRIPSGLGWQFLTPLSFSGEARSVVWVLSDPQHVYALAKATYLVQDNTQSLSDLTVEPTEFGLSTQVSPPEVIMSKFNDPAWIQSNTPKKSVLKDALNASNSQSSSNGSK